MENIELKKVNAHTYQRDIIILCKTMEDAHEIAQLAIATDQSTKFIRRGREYCVYNAHLKYN